MQLSVIEPEPIAVAAPSRERSPTPQAPASAVFLQQLGQWTLLLVLAAVAYLFLNRFVMQTVQVQGQSMVPTLHDADFYFLNRWIYYLNSPKRGDVVVLKDPSDGDYAVKRIIATCGDALYLKNGALYLNGRLLHEPYLAPHTPTYTCAPVDEELILCGRDQYFVMGDNRNNSFDSRMYGPVPRQNILGAIIH